MCGILSIWNMGLFSMKHLGCGKSRLRLVDHGRKLINTHVELYRCDIYIYMYIYISTVFNQKNIYSSDVKYGQYGQFIISHLQTAWICDGPKKP